MPKAQAIIAQKKLKPIDFASIETQIKKIIESYPALQISVTYTDIQTSTTVKEGLNEPYNAASTTKLLTAVLFLQEVEGGKYSLETPVGGVTAKEQLRKMIEVSDNVSWQAFNSLLTGQALDRFAQDTGLLKYDSRTNVATPSDIALLLGKLYKNQLLNQENTQLLLSHMQRASESQYIPTALPAGTKVYHKAGYLADRAHDAAIIDNGERPFVLVIFTKSNGNYDFVLGQKIMHEITGAIWPSYIL